MPIRFRITLLFTAAVFVILGIVCVGIYYFSASNRESGIRKRLTNRATTISRLLAQSEIFDRDLIRRIDSSTSLTLQHKTVQAYNIHGRKIYSYSDLSHDTIHVGSDIQAEARSRGSLFYRQKGKEVVAFVNSKYPGGPVVVCGAVDAEGLNNLARLRSILTASFIGGTLISLIVGWIFSRRLLRPIRQITADVTDISAYNLERRIQTGHNKDEWYQLSDTLNELLDRLKESFELQRRFISNASHELSTPLTLISSQLEVSLQRNRTDEEYRKIMYTVLQDVHHMNNLVQTLLQFATAAGNPGGLSIDLVRIDEVLMRLPGEIHKHDNQFHISLQFGSLPEEEDRLLVLGNEDLLFTAIHNIASNGCKYSDDHRADVSLEVTDKWFIIRISDKGIGMDEKELANIFQPFYRINDAHEAKGFGLGLSLAHRIIKLHKGNISVVSAPGTGTSFTIELPVARPL